MNHNEGQSSDDFLREFLADQFEPNLSDQARGSLQKQMQNDSCQAGPSNQVFQNADGSSGGKDLGFGGGVRQGAGWGSDSSSDVEDNELVNKLTQILQENQGQGQGQQQQKLEGLPQMMGGGVGHQQQQQQQLDIPQGSNSRSQQIQQAQQLEEDNLTRLVRLNADKLRQRFPHVDYSSVQQLLLINGGDYDVVEQQVLESQLMHVQYGEEPLEVQSPQSPQSQNFNPNYTGQALSYSSYSPFDNNNNNNIDYNNAINQSTRSMQQYPRNAPQVERFLEDDQGSMFSRGGGRRGGGVSSRGRGRARRGGLEGFRSNNSYSYDRNRGEQTYYQHDDRMRDASRSSSFRGGRRGDGNTRGRGGQRGRGSNRSIDQYSNQNSNDNYFTDRSSYNNFGSQNQRSAPQRQQQLQQQQSRPSTIREEPPAVWQESDDEDDQVPTPTPTPATNSNAGPASTPTPKTNSNADLAPASAATPTKSNTYAPSGGSKSANSARKESKVDGWDSDDSSDDVADVNTPQVVSNNSQLQQNSFSGNINSNNTNMVSTQRKVEPGPGPGPSSVPQSQQSNNFTKNQGTSNVGPGSSVKQDDVDSSSWKSSSEEDFEPPKKPQAPTFDNNVSQQKQSWQTVQGKHKSNSSQSNNPGFNSQNQTSGNNVGNAGNSVNVSDSNSQVKDEDVGGWGSALEPLPEPHKAPPRSQHSTQLRKSNGGRSGGKPGGRSSSSSRGRSSRGRGRK